jgi:hypothetical protein
LPDDREAKFGRSTRESALNHRSRPSPFANANGFRFLLHSAGVFPWLSKPPPEILHPRTMLDAWLHKDLIVGLSTVLTKCFNSKLPRILDTSSKSVRSLLQSRLGYKPHRLGRVSN